MPRAIALTNQLVRQAAHRPLETARTAVVCGCAGALIAAGAFLPFA